MSERARASGTAFWGDADDTEALQGYRTLVNTTGDGIYQLDAEDRFVAVNDGIVEMTGYAREDLLGDHVSVLFGDDGSALERELERLGTDSSGRSEPFECIVQPADGEPVRCEVRMNPLEGDGTACGAVGVVRDLTDRDRTNEATSERDEREERERERKRKERRFEAIFEDPNILVGLLECDGTVLDVNRTAMEYIDADLDEVAGQPFWETPWWGDGDGAESDVERWVERAAAGEYVDFEADLTRPDGTEYVLNGVFRPVTNDDGEVVSVIVSDRDTTERKQHERELAESERRYRTLAEYFPNGLVTLFDGDLEYTLAAGQGFDRIPVEPDELEGRSFADAWDDDAAAALEPAFESALDGEERSVEVEYAGRDWIVHVIPITDERGDVFAGMTMAQDITERKEHERELAKYETIVETINDGIYVKDETGRFTMVNDAYAELTGYDREELLGAHASLVVDEDVVEQSEEMRAAMADEDGGNPTLEAGIQTADGDVVPAEGTFSSLRTGDGEQKQVGVVRDITERKEQRRRIEESERRYRTLAEHFPNGAVGVYDDDLRYTLTEGAVLGDTLPSADRLEGNRVPELFPEETAANLEPLFRAAIEDGETGTIETVIAGRDWQVWATPLHDADGDVFAGLSFAQDITDQVERERRLEELVGKLEESNERLEQFAYAASHDLQEPLRMVSSYLQLIERRYGDEFDEDGREFIEFAVDGADRMRDMIEGLLQYSRVDTQGDEFEPVDLDAVLANAREDLQMRIEESDAEITAEPLPSVEGDEGQLRQVFQNLVDNAIEYSGDEPPRVHVSAERDAGEWLVSLRDEGIGIDPDDQDHVFEVFHRLHSPDEYSGTGIGLALCERIVERHGGDIWVESEPGEGSTFSFTMPAESDSND